MEGVILKFAYENVVDHEFVGAPFPVVEEHVEKVENEVAY